MISELTEPVVRLRHPPSSRSTTVRRTSSVEKRQSNPTDPVTSHKKTTRNTCEMFSVGSMRTHGTNPEVLNNPASTPDPICSCRLRDERIRNLHR